ncbi:Protein translocase subunit SecD [Jeotgalicoccus aerolatus]|uniref:Multifunctional fusion protein n=1 Tax=Jeotgalicoccus aerolatus TaxID=709510 RepID=A0ABS4HL30_9STAP|nr:protein translocase subunit SecDF [Jeotgalicoccus aerolatus]MBP1951622.1 SecD/SecF fusion protein [Jeotgalicoccus aerolatus]NMA81565.1 protein translocase subunit SecDF [Jeotgalicoccus aerolatus]GGD96063.1 bifunctional preprotein translocase subunit SecD/SecF [Jeotgalicoccus aerolatus]CAD2075908.1 Protein translocase subunit SecD [Jeotgalicoccus aerolatus]
MKKKSSKLIIALMIVVVLFTAIGLTLKDVLKDVNLGLDLQGGFEVLYQVEPLEEGDTIDDSAVESTASTLDSRVNVLGVSEPNIQIEDNNRIRVQLAGIDDQQEARELLSTQAELTIRDVDDNVLLSGKDLVQGGASQGFDEMNNAMVSLELRDSDKFREVTEEISQKPAGENLMVIWMDFTEGEDSFREEVQKENPKFISAPTVSQPINSTDVMISGGFDGQEGVERAQNISALLNSGSLPVKLTEVYSTSVGAQFGEEALDETVTAGLIGVGLVFLFMLVFYRLPGLVAVVTLTVYIYLTIAGFNAISGVLTLPGIAALILGVGMAVDANIILYERLKDELRIGRTLKHAYKKAASSSIWTIVDANLTTLIAAIVLFIFGTSSVKGFATMLLLSILMSFVTAVFLTRVIMSLIVKSNYFNRKIGLFGVKQKNTYKISEGKEIEDLTTPWDRFDFVKHANKFFAFSGIIVAAGLIILFIFKLNLGIDFTSGTRADIATDGSATTEEVETELTELGIPPENLTMSGENTIVARYGTDLSQDEVTSMQTHFSELYGSEPMVSTVSPVIGQELVQNAIIALIIASIGIIIYASIRFEWRMAVPAVIALLHDVFMILAVFSIFRIEVDITIIAAVLTVVGYSINDTIVTLDRIRENNRKIKVLRSEEEIDIIINRSLRQTATRSLNTVLTVIVVVVLLVLFGATSIFNFSLALLIGLVSGVYSSFFIAIQLWGVLKRRQLRKSGGELVVYDEKSKNDDKVVV